MGFPLEQMFLKIYIGKCYSRFSMYPYKRQYGLRAFSSGQTKSKKLISFLYLGIPYYTLCHRNFTDFLLHCYSLLHTAKLTHKSQSFGKSSQTPSCMRAKLLHRAQFIMKYICIQSQRFPGLQRTAQTEQSQSRKKSCRLLKWNNSGWIPDNRQNISSAKGSRHIQ